MKSAISVVTVVLIAIGLAPTIVDAQPGSPRTDVPTMRAGRFEAEVRTMYCKADGLPDDNTFSVAVADNGDVYAAGAAGLARFHEGKWAPVAGIQGTPTLVAANGPDILAVTDACLFRIGPQGPARMALLPADPRGANVVRHVAAGRSILLATNAGLYEFADKRIVPVYDLNRLLGTEKEVRQVAIAPDGRLAAAALNGLFVRTPGAQWNVAYPRSGSRSWAPHDVRGAAFDSRGRLWFASPQGVGCLDGDKWALYTEHDGLPYDDFTIIAAGENGVVWFGTQIGAVRFDGTTWEYRQGLRWLPDDAVRSIAVTDKGCAWFATAKGVGLIDRKPVTLAEKAAFFEEEIDKYHRRTPYGFVLSVALPKPGDKSKWIQHDSDNDGLWTSMYGAGECFAYGATKDPKAKRRAKAAFEALNFLREVTQGGSHPAPPGFVARTVLPISGPNPNDGRVEADRRERAHGDALWKVIDPRWPVSQDGKWYWKSDTSSDELDGHFFFYAAYYDLVADTDQEKARVRHHVGAIADHLIAHDFQLVDHDGLPTRWARYSPKDLNFSKDWWEEKGLNSLSILSYLSTAEHICGSGKYRQAVEKLVGEHGYATNLMYPKNQFGMGSGNQSDDEMAFMNYYNLIKYADPELRQIAAKSLSLYWGYIEPELNPLFNFIYAASCTGQVYTSADGRENLSPRSNTWLAESLDTLKRFPLDRICWRQTNSHRKDLVRVPRYAQGRNPSVPRGHRRNGKVIPIDERWVEYWNHDPWELDTGGNGHELADGQAFLLPYYMGLYHRFLAE